MPTITFSLKDLQHLLHKKVSITELEDLMEYAKGEVEGYDEATDDVTVSLDDTNLPYLWSTEGLARYFHGVLSSKSGLVPLQLGSPSKKIIASNSIHDIRPFIAGFIAKGTPLTDYALRQLVQLQEKFCDGYGRKRKNASIGLYSFKRITFPVHYKAVDPDSVRFVPLEMSESLSLREILDKHPKGVEYGGIIKGNSHYPLLIDDAGKVLSLPPIINSNDLGRLEVGDTDFLFECTGLDEETVNLGAAIFAYALADRGYTIEPMTMEYAKKNVVTPVISHDTVKINHTMIQGLIGIELGETEITKLLHKAGYGYDNGLVTIPAYRRDILHPVDVIEDIAILYGYENIKSLPLTSYTRGGTLPLQGFVNKARELAVGLGYQEVFSAVLTNKKLLYEQARFPDTGTIEIENYMSENFSIVRSTILPILLELLSKNKHVEYPQKVFEEGLVSRRHGEATIDYNLLSLASTHSSATITEAKQAADAILSALHLKGEYHELEHSTFISGRAAKITVDGVEVAILGEVHPQVLENFGLELPVVMVEMNLIAVFNLLKK